MPENNKKKKIMDDIMRDFSQSDKDKIQSIDEKVKLLEAQLKGNLDYQQVLTIALKRVDIAIERNNELKKILDSVIDKDKIKKRKKDGLVFKKSGVSYFMDKGSKTPPLNSDSLIKRQIRTQNKVPEVIEQKKWFPKDENLLASGVRQQAQQLLMGELFNHFEGEDQDIDTFDSLLKEIEVMPDEDLENYVTTETCQHIDWKKISETCFNAKRSQEDCRVHWYAQRQIKNKSWDKKKDIELVKVATNHGCRDWVLISEDLQSKHLPHQCFTRYQRSLNRNLLRSTWTEEENKLLREAVKRFGDKNWQQVASCLTERTGQQCMHRWTKTLQPTIVRGRWGADEDRRLALAVASYENSKKPRWALIRNHINGRTDVQCRERWKNILDPILNSGNWSKDEDKHLLESTEKHGIGKWAKIAKDLYPRTDNQCCRRWKQLNADKLPEYQANLVVKRHYVNNFVGRENEKSLVTHEDFDGIVDIDELLKEEAENKILRSQKRSELLTETLFLKNETENIPCVTLSINPNPNSVFSTSLPLTEDDIASLRTYSRKTSTVAPIETEYLSLPLAIPSETNMLALTNLLTSVDNNQTLEDYEHEDQTKKEIVEDPHFKLLTAWLTSLFVIPANIYEKESLVSFPKDIKSSKKRERQGDNPPQRNKTKRTE